MAIKRELGALEGVQSVEADETSKEVVVTFEAPADMQKINSLMEEIGYPIATG
jgi:copper chaperone CopZ